MVSDTHAAIAAMHRENYSRLTKEDRLSLTLQICAEMRRLALDGLRHRRPELSEEELKRELMRMLYGSDCLK